MAAAVAFKVTTAETGPLAAGDDALGFDPSNPETALSFVDPASLGFASVGAVGVAGVSGLAPTFFGSDAEIVWADIAEDTPVAREVQWWSEEYKMAERLEGWEVPNLTLRSDITVHFPVSLEALEVTADGRERFRVMFDMRLDEWAMSRSESQDECSEYAAWVATRLVFALQQYSYKYHVEAVGGDDDCFVAVFAMAHPSAEERRGRAAIPTLSSFEVTWEQDPADHTRHLVVPHFKRMRDSGTDPRVMVTTLLDTLLEECDDCTVAPPERGVSHIMVVTIPSAPAPKRRACACFRCGGTAAAAPMAVAVAAALGGAGGPAPARAAPAAPAAAPARAAPGRGPRALDVMRANRLAWDREGRIHFIKNRGPENAARIMAEISACSDCVVEPTPKHPVYMCKVTMI
jgi:hypothetical protein